LEKGINKTIFLLEESLDISEKRKRLVINLPFPLGALYKDLLIRRELEETISFFDVLKLSSVLLKYLASVTISDYLQYFKEKKWSSQEVNKAILDYFRNPTNEGSHKIVRLILIGFQQENIKPSLPGILRLLKRCPPDEILPPFINLKGTLIDAFLFFFRLQEEILQGAFSLREPPQEIILGYYGLLEYILFNLLSVFDFPIYVPVKGMKFNCYAPRGAVIKPQKTKFVAEEDFLEKNHFKAMLYLGSGKFLTLHPFLYLQDVSGGKGRAAGNLLFLHRASGEEYTFMDFQTSREVEIKDVDIGLKPTIESLLKKIQTDAPREKKGKPSPVISFKEFIDFHCKNFAGRELILKELDAFVKTDNSKYAVVEGEEGRGKTALLCRFVRDKKETPCIYHFVRKVNDQDNPVVILRSLIAQLMRIKGHLDIGQGDIPYEISKLVEMLKRRLQDTAAFCGKNAERLIFILDGLDDIADIRAALEMIPEILPDNVVGILSLKTMEDTSRLAVELNTRVNGFYEFKDCPLAPLTRGEIAIYLKKAGLPAIKIKEKLIEKIFWASMGGDPMMVRLITDSIVCGQISFETMSCLPEKPPKMSMDQWREFLDSDDYYRINIQTVLYRPSQPRKKSKQVLLYDILGAIMFFRHPVSDDELAKAFRCDVFRIMLYRRMLNKFLLIENGRYSIHNHKIVDIIETLFSTRDYIRLHKKIIDFYEVRKWTGEVKVLDSKALSLDALCYLHFHHYQLGVLTRDYTEFFRLVGDDQFRLEQGLRLNLQTILDSLRLAAKAAVETNDIKSLIKYGFLFDDIKSGGIKGGLSMIVSQAVEGNFTEALQMTSKIQDDSFRYKQMLILVWLLARSNDFMKTMDILDEALIIPGATFAEEEEDLIFSIVEAVIGIGIAEGMDILKSGVNEERIVKYYSRLADILSDYPDLILKIATGASMQLRKISDEGLKSKFILQFGRIIIQLDDEIKKRQFFENFIYEARNLEDEQIRYTTLTELAHGFVDVDWARCEDVFREILNELENMSPHSPLRYKLEANVAGKIAQLNREEWAIELFSSVIERATGLMVADERAEVFRDIARSLVFLEDPVKRAEFLEYIFSLADSFESISQQAKVMVGVSEVLTDSDEDVELLNIYLETFKFIDELPIDIAVKEIERIAGNMKVIRDEEWLMEIMTIFSNLISALETPEEKARVFIPIGEGLAKSRNLRPETHYEYLNGLVEVTSEISGFEGEKYSGITLGKIGGYIIGEDIYQKDELISHIIKKAAEFEDEQARLPVYQAIGEDIFKLGSADEIEWIYEYLESVVRECNSTRIKGQALMKMVRGITRIENRVLRDRLLDKIIYIAENLEVKIQAYRILSSITGGLIIAGDEEEGIELYKRALSQIPLKEEKAPDALGGVMAGLCRGIAAFASHGWARDIYKKLINRLDFIAPEKKKLEVFLGITDGLKALEDRKLLRDYFMELIDFIQRFISPREKTLGFLRLAHCFLEIGEKDESRRMWERCITVATTLNDDEDGKLKADTLAEALVSIWSVENNEWLNQASKLIFEGAAAMSLKHLPDFMEQSLAELEKISQTEIRLQVMELIMVLMEKIKDPEKQIRCIAAASRGIKNIKQPELLRLTLERVVKSINKVKRGINRVRAMAIITANFLHLGVGDWAERAFKGIEKAYKRLKDNKVKSVVLGEMAKIPFSTSNAQWQDDMAGRVLQEELPLYEAKERNLILQAMIGAMAQCERKEWAKSQIDRYLELSADMPQESINEIYHSLFKGFADVGDIESIFEYRDRIRNRDAWDISSQYLREALLQSVKVDISSSFNYYRRIDDKKVKVGLLKQFFDQLMIHKTEFEAADFVDLYKDMLELSINDRDTLDFVIGKIVSYYNDEYYLKEIGETLGILDKDMHVLPPAQTAVLATPSIFEALKEMEEPLDLVSDLEQLEITEKPQPAEKDERKPRGLLHGRSSMIKKTLPDLGTIPDSTDISEFLKDGHRLVKAHYFREAIRYFEKAIKIYPEDHRGFIGMASIYYILRDYRHSATYYSDAVRLNPMIDNMKRFLKGVPRNAYLWYEFAKNLHRQGEYDETIKLCDLIKSEGVYFDFAKKVDVLKKTCIEEKEGKVKKPLPTPNKFLLTIALILLLLFLLPSIGRWFHYTIGNNNMKTAESRVQGYAEGMKFNKNSEYIGYTAYFKRAANNFKRIRGPSTFFSKEKYLESRLKRAICKYKIGHFPVLNADWKITIEWTPVETGEAELLRQEAVDELEKILKEDDSNYIAMYYLGLCNLDFAIVPSDSVNISRSNRKAYLFRAIKYLEDSLHYASNNADVDSYLMLAKVRIETFIRFRNESNEDMLKKALKELDKASSFGEDPRVLTYQYVAYALLGKWREARATHEKANKSIRKNYRSMSRKEGYWLRKLRQFKELIDR